MNGQLILRRVLLAIPTIAAISVLVFGILFVMPGNPAQLIQGQQADPAVTKALVKSWGLDQPVTVRFERWAENVVRLNLGTSLTTGRSVVSMIGSRLPYSILLGAVGILFGLAVGIPAGTLSAYRSGSILDSTLTVAALVGITVPTFVLALGLQLFAYYSGVLPIAGAGSSFWSVANLTHVILPAVTLGAFQAGVTARVVRVSILEELAKDYVRTARGKGVSEFTVLRKHALPNVLIPLVTLIGFYMQTMFGGLLLAEIIFGWPGIGRLFYDAVLARDYPVIQGVALMIAVTVYFANLMVDVIYSFVDPRVRVEGT